MKKIFGSLAVLAILFTAVACGGSTTDIGAIGSLSGGDVTYDETTASVSKVLTVSLSGAKLTAAHEAGESLDTIVSYEGTEVTGVTTTLYEATEANATSFKILISGVPTAINWNDSPVTGTDTTAFSGNFILLIDGASVLTMEDSGKGKVMMITGGKFSNIKTVSSGAATVTAAAGSVTVKKTDSSVTCTTTTFTLTGCTTSLKADDTLTATVYKSDKTTESTIKLNCKVSSVADGTYTLSFSLPTGATLPETAETGGSVVVHIPADKLTKATNYGINPNGYDLSYGFTYNAS